MNMTYHDAIWLWNEVEDRLPDFVIRRMRVENAVISRIPPSGDPCHGTDPITVGDFLIHWGKILTGEIIVKEELP